MNHEDHLQDLDQLLMDLVAGELTPAQQRHLMALLRDNPVAREQYLGYLNTDSLLAWEFSQGVRNPEGEAKAPGSRAMASETTEGGAAAHGPGGSVSVSRARWVWGRWAAVAAAAGAFLVLLAGISRWRHSDPQPVAPARESAGFAPAADLASVVKLDGVQWETGPGARPAEGEALGSSRLNLRSGRITLSLLSGVLLTLEGPAVLDLISVERVFCHRGKLRARVPAEAKGFIVSSPGSAVLDLGTEFGFNIDADGKARVMVFEGFAEVTMLSAAGIIERSQLVEQSHAVELDPRTGQIKESTPEPKWFVTPPDPLAQDLTLSPAYPGAVRDSHPVGYWRFESMTGGMTPNEIPGRPPLRATGPIEIASAGRDNRCAVFQDAVEVQYLSLDGLWEAPNEPGHAIELWAMAERNKYATLVALVQSSNELYENRHLSLLELSFQSLQSVLKPASIRFLHRWPPGIKSGFDLYSSKIYIPYFWYHLVAQKNGNQMELYVNGNMIHSMPIDTDEGTIPCRLLVGRPTMMTPAPSTERDLIQYKETLRRRFVGRIDEIAIYDRPLSAAEVERHFQLARSR